MIPKVSLILPTYNVETYIAQCLESCLKQTLREIEILIVDDCGSDQSIKIAEEYAKKDSRVKILHNPNNQGTFLSRNNGAMGASADYLFFLDPDDFLELNALEILYNATQNFSYDLIRAGAWRFYGAEKEVFISYKTQEFQSLESYVNFVYRQKNIAWNICGSLIKKEKFLKAIKVLNTQQHIAMAEDVLMSFALWNCSCAFIHLESMLYHYRFNPHSIGNKKSQEVVMQNLEDFNFVLEKIKELSKGSHPKLKKLFLATIINAKYAYLSNLKLNFLATLQRWFINRYFVLRRKLRIQFGI